ncbi:hypothetical protein UPYG_G00013280 [Umbra pygmaea]|uniref:Testis-expressed protein 49 n=1 Tax=Umbra pygmaea TaxID=75934 RepID=A0ABD0XXV2_UMBPY
MAFFGITNLGYQNPIGDKMLVNPQASASPCHDVDSRSWTNQSGLPPFQVHRTPSKYINTCSNMDSLPPFSTEIHRGSQERYREMLKRVQTPRSPNQLYSVPITENQQCGWWLPNGGLGKMSESWTKVKRFPRKNSEMTKFVQDMSMKDREFILF